MEIAAPEVKVVNMTENSAFNMELKMYATPAFDDLEMSKPPKSLALNEPLYVAIKRNPDPQIKMAAQDCWASVSPDPQR